MKLRILILLLMVWAYASPAQEETCKINCDNGWCWGSKPEEAQQNWTLLDDNVKMKLIKDAEAPLEWLLTNAPCLNKALYIRGEEVYKTLERESTGEIEIAYQDKLLSLLDMRVKYIGGTKAACVRKGVYTYPYYVNRGGKTISEKKPHWKKMSTIYLSLIHI